jgi:putative tricarboxylic transport membrane protein
MEETLRHFFKTVAVTVLALGFGAASAGAQDLELTLTAPAGAGGGWDAAARSIQEVMTSTGQALSVQVVNVPGAGGTIGLAQFANSGEGDPSELLVGGITMVGAIIMNQSPVDLSSVTPIARLTGDPLVVAVPASSPIETVDDLLEQIRSDIGGTTWAGGSAGGADHMLAAMVTEAAGEDASKVNYVAYSGGGEALAAILSGQVTAGVSGYGEWEGQFEAGELRALAISYPEPIEGLDVPTLKEQGVDVELVNWRGVFGKPGLSDEDKAMLNEAFGKMVASEEWQSLIETRGWTDYYMPADEYASFMETETARVRKILESVGLAQ